MPSTPTIKSSKADPPDGGFETADVKPGFLHRLGELVDLKTIANSDIKVVFDPFWGAGRGYSCHILREAGVEVETVHDYRDVLFGGHAPEPDDHLLGDCQNEDEGIRREDRHRHRRRRRPLRHRRRRRHLHSAQLHHRPALRLPRRNPRLEATASPKASPPPTSSTRSPSTTRYRSYETPVGFKYIGELIIADKIAIGGEESAGLTIRGHVPEKDGIIAGLLVAEMVAARGKSLGAPAQGTVCQGWFLLPRSRELPLDPGASKPRSLKKLKNDPTELSGRKVTSVVRTDGLKLILDDGSWVCFRLSGTEPVVRAYTEVRSEKDMAALRSAAEKFVQG